MPPQPGVAADAGADAGPVEGCVEIRIDGTVMDEPEKWKEAPIWMAQQPFWVDERASTPRGSTKSWPRGRSTSS